MQICAASTTSEKPLASFGLRVQPPSLKYFFEFLCRNTLLMFCPFPFPFVFAFLAMALIRSISNSKQYTNPEGLTPATEVRTLFQRFTYSKDSTVRNSPFLAETNPVLGSKFAAKYVEPLPTREK